MPGRRDPTIGGGSFSFVNGSSRSIHVGSVLMIHYSKPFHSTSESAEPVTANWDMVVSCKPGMIKRAGYLPPAVNVVAVELLKAKSTTRVY